MNPKISVIMPVYNTEKYLQESIESILNQTFSDFEFICIDDGSSDRSPQILEKYHEKDERIQIITNPLNQGVIASLNTGLSAAKGTYIARMDADDISEPTRFEKQVTYLENHPEVGILGCACNVVDHEGEFNSLSQYPETDTEIRWHCLFFSPFCHPGVMIRKNVLGTAAYPTIKHAEDFALWSLLLPGTKAHNLAQPYLNYRRLEESISLLNAEQQQQNAVEIARSNINALLKTSCISEEECQTLRRWRSYQFPEIALSDQIRAVKKYISIYNQFEKTYRPIAEFKLQTKNQIFDLLVQIKIHSGYQLSALLQLAFQAFRLSLKFFAKFILSK